MDFVIVPLAALILGNGFNRAVAVTLAMEGATVAVAENGQDGHDATLNVGASMNGGRLTG